VLTKGAPECVGSALRPVQRALDGVGDSLARHFADWGVTSRFATGGEPAAIARVALVRQWIDAGKRA
jgi:hypothetical protein